MEPTTRQFAFLADLRRGGRRAAANLDASVAEPPIRADLVPWDDEPGDAARDRLAPSTIFT